MDVTHEEAVGNILAVQPRCGTMDGVRLDCELILGQACKPAN
jgi:hypothetical protein